MTTDRYTRIVLTVIAGALLYLCVLFSAPPLSAQAPPQPFNASVLAPSKPQPVVIVGWGTFESNGEIHVATVKDPNGRVHADTRLPVALDPAQSVAVSLGVTPDHPLPVGLTTIAPGQVWEPIRTKAEPAPTRTRPGGGH